MGVMTKITKVRSYIGVQGSEKADRLADEAAEGCVQATQFDHDVSELYTEPVTNKLWLQHTTQKSFARHDPDTTNASLDNLTNNLPIIKPGIAYYPNETANKVMLS